MAAVDWKVFRRRICFNVVVVAVCGGLFLALSWDQMKEYLAKRTSVSQLLEVAEHRRLPQVMLCPKTPFQVEVAKTSEILFDREAYLRDATHLNVSFMGRIFSDYVFYKEKNYTTWDLFTYYSGVCRIFKIDMELQMNEYVAFIVDKDAVISFVEEGEELFFRTAESITPTALVPITSSAMVKVQPSRLERLQTGDSCRRYNMLQYIDCLKELFLREQNGNVCSDLTSEPYFPGMEFCEPYELSTQVQVMGDDSDNEEEEDAAAAPYKTHATDLSFMYVSRSFRGEAGECFRPCETNSFQVELLPLLHMDEESLGGHIIYVSFASMYHAVETEYLIHNFGSIVAALGGALGLFLGVSLMQALNAAFDVTSKMPLWGYEKQRKAPERTGSSKQRVTPTATVLKVVEPPATKLKD